MVYKVYITEFKFINHLIKAIFVGSDYPKDPSIENQAINALLDEAFYTISPEWSVAVSKEINGSDNNISIKELKTRKDLDLLNLGPAWKNATPHGHISLHFGDGITVENLLDNAMLLRKLDYERWLK